MTRRHEVGVAAVVIILVLSFGLLLGVLTDEGRGPAVVTNARALEGGDALALDINTCHGKPRGEVESEDDVQVVVRVVADVQTGPGDGCLDIVTVRLSRPLADRRLVDASTGKTVSVVRR